MTATPHCEDEENDKKKCLSKIHDKKMEVIGWSTDEAYLEVEKLVTASSCSEEEPLVCDT